MKIKHIRNTIVPLLTIAVMGCAGVDMEKAPAYQVEVKKSVQELVECYNNQYALHQMQNNGLKRFESFITANTDYGVIIRFQLQITTGFIRMYDHGHSTEIEMIQRWDSNKAVKVVVEMVKDCH